MKVTAVSAQESKALKHKRRFCKVEGCERIVKSQGLCQRHGAKPRKCKIDGCEKQAQGNFDGMCKSHFKASSTDPNVLPLQQSSSLTDDPPQPEGEGVYERVIPESIAWTPGSGGLMPLVEHLKAGFDAGKPPGWHRNEERRARGLWPVSSPAAQLEGWERELVWTEILILTGNCETSFRHLARAWGRDKGFQTVLAQFICERKGDVGRKAKNQPQAPLPMCVEIPRRSSTASSRMEQFQEEGTTTSASATTQDGAAREVWDAPRYQNNSISRNEEFAAEYQNNSLSRNEELAADLFSFPPGHVSRVSRFASFEFDSTMLEEIDRDAQAIISHGSGEEETNRNRQAS